jgi:hypothetical protein
MSNERIDLTELEEQFKDGLNWDDMNTMELITELKRCYERLDKVEAMLKDNGLWVSQEGWEESDKDDKLIVSMDYLIQALREASE